MLSLKEIFKKAVENGIIAIKEFNAGLHVYVIYRIVWETKSHYILYSVESEEEAKKIVNGFNSDEYYYQKLRVN